MSALPATVLEPKVVERIARLESEVAHIQENLAEVRQDVRDLRQEVRQEFKEVRQEIRGLADSLASAKLWALVLYIGLAGGLLLVLARGFKWI